MANADLKNRLLAEPIGEPSAVATMARPNEGQRVSVAEARRIALAIVAEAEARRAAFAEEEAAVEAVWEEKA
ncbi:MAG: hypothetical protein FJ291_00510 [Planctomycetes bacterium]|nr:hypothetical protein [Planctomycetota bacterium]